jgi:hypothetical protein
MFGRSSRHSTLRSSTISSTPPPPPPTAMSDTRTRDRPSWRAGSCWERWWGSRGEQVPKAYALFMWKEDLWSCTAFLSQNNLAALAYLAVFCHQRSDNRTAAFTDRYPGRKFLALSRWIRRICAMHRNTGSQIHSGAILVSNISRCMALPPYCSPYRT